MSLSVYVDNGGQSSVVGETRNVVNSSFLNLIGWGNWFCSESSRVSSAGQRGLRASSPTRRFETSTEDSVLLEDESRFLEIDLVIPCNLRPIASSSALLRSPLIMGEHAFSSLMRREFPESRMSLQR